MTPFERFLRQATTGMAVLLAVTTVAFGIYYYLTFVVPRDSGSVAEATVGGLEGMVQENPNDPNLRAAVANLYFQQGDYEQAVTQAQAALKLAPQHQSALLVLAQARRKLGREEEALKTFQEVVDLNRDNPMAKSSRTLAAAYFALGQIAASRGRPEDAITGFEGALGIDAGDADARFELGKAHQSLGHHEKALDAFGAAVRYVPEFREAYEAMLSSYQALANPAGVGYARGMVAYATGESAAAVALLKEATVASSEWPEAHLGLGLALEQLGRTEEARAEYQRALQLNGKDFLAGYSLERLKGKAGQGAVGRS